jgi:hypothetical protein
MNVEKLEYLMLEVVSEGGGRVHLVARRSCTGVCE